MTNQIALGCGRAILSHLVCKRNRKTISWEHLLPVCMSQRFWYVLFRYFIKKSRTGRGASHLTSHEIEKFFFKSFLCKSQKARIFLISDPFCYFYFRYENVRKPGKESHPTPQNVVVNLLPVDLICFEVGSQYYFLST